MYMIKVVYKAGHDEYYFKANDWEEVLKEFRLCGCYCAPGGGG